MIIYPLAFPLTMLSTSFIPAQAMPDRLAPVAECNPVSSVVTASRELFGNPSLPSDAWPAEHAVLVSTVAPLVLMAIVVPLALRRFSRLGRRTESRPGHAPCGGRRTLGASPAPTTPRTGPRYPFPPAGSASDPSGSGRTRIARADPVRVASLKRRRCTRRSGGNCDRFTPGHDGIMRRRAGPR
ncbi:ABC transporter permease [Nocardiopsis salina]|uniref:ABC transporter permease n=1 Tax=Nocardiopsis salina TaxID=245836 RepID=UPI001EF9FB11|nr:ABC transporter permease [Nocardiopsis salina]